MKIGRPLPSLPNLLRIAAALLLSFAAALSQAQQPAATYARGSLSVNIPYNAPEAGPGKLVAEILDPEDHSLARIERPVEAHQGQGSWQAVLVPAEPIPFEEILWQRLRYRFEYAALKLPPIEGVDSISGIMRRPVLHILGQKQYLAASQAAIRVLVSEAASHQPQTGQLRIELLAPNRDPLPLYSGNLNRRGTAEASLRFPAGLTGSLQLRFTADTPIGSAAYTQPIQLEDKASILLTTEKPLYQPGQTIHVRALALDRADRRAAADRKLTFELEDFRGNKVFRKATATDSFGIASAEFALADEVNLGAYHLRALMGEPQAPANAAEIAIQVERYVLPKFKVEVEFDQNNGKPRRDYRPGDRVTGSVRANYFFGKPVAGAQLTLKASAIDVELFEAASATGQTDAGGVYRFDLKLPAFFAGRPLNQGSTRVLVEAAVKDSAGHSETRGEPITVSESPLLITAIPEGGSLVAGIENEVFLLASYPDGSPAAATLTVHDPDEADRNPIPLVIEEGLHNLRLTTDASGIAILRVKPRGRIDALTIDADDHRGNRVTSTVPLATRSGTDQILLHASRALFKAGDRIDLTILSTRTRGAAYIDIFKNGQTILTRDLDLENGQAELTLIATPEMAGTLDIDAYLFGRDAQPIADHRIVFVQPAGELKIETTADAPAYRPGSEARVSFHVTTARGQGVQAALGVQVVDEAVFALAEKEPGFAKLFFFLEQEAMKPRYEIHSLSMNDVVQSKTGSGDAQNLAARALFSATEMANPAKLDIEFGSTLPQDNFAEYQQRYSRAFQDQITGIAAQLNEHLAAHPGSDILQAFAALDHGAPPRDAWGTPLRIDPSGWVPGWRHLYLVRSAGPDRTFRTDDDLTASLENRSGEIAGPTGLQAKFDLRIEHNRGPVDDRCQITGAVTDATGAIIPNATIHLRDLASHQSRAARSDAAGSFTFAALPAGRYQIEIESPGFQRSTYRAFSLQARDLAILNATLQIGAVTQTVNVAANQAVMDVPMQFQARAQAGIGLGNGNGNEDTLKLKAAAPIILRESAKAEKLPVNGRSFSAALAEPAPEEPHIRSYFPEALYINPEILTDGSGNASITLPIADSITTWRMALLASTQSGSLGSGTSSLKVFQDFFVDLDLPVTLTQGDRVSLPVAAYNYSGSSGQVSLQLQPADWYALDNDTAQKSLAVEPGRIGGSHFTLTANRIGKFKLTLSARMTGANGALAGQDIVVREIEVIPNGREQSIVFNGRLSSSAKHEIAFPAASIPDASSVIVRLYPGPLSQIVEGMDSILRMPGGCFEQTSSSTYPNVLALDYMKRVNKLTPEVHAKAESYIANGYQRLLTFEVPGGGFSWFGQAPANKILTAYGLMEFHDMAQVSGVDPRLIERTATWLASQQQSDGSWQPDTSFINEGATNRFNTDRLRITAYIAWSLANIGFRGPGLDKAKRYIDSYCGPAPDAYTLAVIANFAADYAKDRDFTLRATQTLVAAATVHGDSASWSAGQTGVYSTGQSAAIETTGLAVQALLKSGQASETVHKALNFIASARQASGSWGTTQATIMALRALLLSTEFGSAQTRGSVAIALNGKTLQTLELTGENSDLLHQFVFKASDLAAAQNPASPASIELNFQGDGALAYQVVGRFFTPWEENPPSEALSIGLAYDRTRLPQNSIATATATIRNNLDKTANMVMVDLGIPPGFELLSEDLQSFQEKSAAQLAAGPASGSLEKFSLTATQAILYFNALAPRQTLTLSFRLRARYPFRARTFSSRVYEYYDPQIAATARPVQLEVTEPD